ncbi:Annexin repeat, partial [Parasponia andersonii]
AFSERLENVSHLALYNISSLPYQSSITRSHRMAFPNEVQHLIKTFSGLGVDEKLLTIILAKWEPEKRQTFRKGCPDLFIKYERQFEHWLDDNIKRLEQEFLRFKNAIIWWTMHPWERDARLARKAMKDDRQSYLLVEITCTRSSEELLGARRAYHCLFDHSIEEDAAHCIKDSERK